MAKIQQIPRMADFPAVAAAKEKLNGLQSKLADLEREIEARQPRGNDVQSRAAALLDGDGGFSTNPLSANEAAKKADERRVLHRAIEIQRRRVDTAVAAAAREASTRMQAKHRELSRGVFLAVLALVEVSRNESEFRTALADEYLLDPAILPAAQYSPLPEKGDLTSRLRTMTEDLFAAGIIDEKDVAKIGDDAVVESIMLSVRVPGSTVASAARRLASKAKSWMGNKPADVDEWDDETSESATLAEQSA